MKWNKRGVANTANAFQSANVQIIEIEMKSVMRFLCRPVLSLRLKIGVIIPYIGMP